MSSASLHTHAASVHFELASEVMKHFSYRKERVSEGPRSLGTRMKARCLTPQGGSALDSAASSEAASLLACASTDGRARDSKEKTRRRSIVTTLPGAVEVPRWKASVTRHEGRRVDGDWRGRDEGSDRPSVQEPRRIYMRIWAIWVLLAQDEHACGKGGKASRGGASPAVFTVSGAGGAS